MDKPEIWYRYEDIVYAAPLDEYDNPQGSGRMEIVLREYFVKHHTPKGVRLIGGRFVLNDSNKKFACPTKELALESFLARKARQRRIYQARLNRIDEAIAWAKFKVPV